VQFESIHPYLDGNGRVGKLVIARLLEHWKLLGAPLLYLSLHFKRRRRDHYRLLNEVRRTGDWEAWIRFFLEGVSSVETIARNRGNSPALRRSFGRCRACKGTKAKGRAAREQVAGSGPT